MYGGGVSPQAYDRAITVFSPDGRLFQVEYAKEAVKRGATALGIVAKDSVVMAAVKTLYSTLVEEDTVRKVHNIDDHILITSSGLIADARRLVDMGREQAQKHRMSFGEKAPVFYVAKYVADIMQLYTQYGGGRPFGVSMLIGGVDDASIGKLYEIEPSGALTGYKADSIGEGKKEVDAFLEKHYNPNITLPNALKLAAKALDKTQEKGLNADQFEIAYMSFKEEGFKYLTVQEREKLLKA